MIARGDVPARLRALTRPQRVAVLAAVLALAAAAVLAVVFARDTRVALFATPMRAEQQAEVEERLAAWNVPYASAAGNVRVERRRRSELLLRLALAGVPHAHLAGSDEVLSRVGALTPQSVLEAQTRDALAADLALGLRGLDGVADARVVIAPSSTGVYADEPRRDASASVRVSLSAGARLTAPAVAGIRAFVAGGVPGLEPGRVAVLDDRGLVLGANDGGDDAADVQTALQSALDGAFGAGATIVRVHREPLGERRDVSDVRRAALGGSIARATSDERYASSAKKYSKSTGTDDRGSETHEEHRSAAADATARLTVAVFVDARRGLDLPKIRTLAAATAGIHPERGDGLSIEAVAFAGIAARNERAAAAPGWLLALASAAPQTVSGVLAVLAVAFGARPSLAALVRLVETASARSAAQVAGIPPARVHGALDGEPPHVAAAIISALPTPTAAAVLELYPADERAAIVRRLATANPRLVPSAEDLLRVRG